jgi:transcriptional regulator with XRE-family HTH domain
MFIFTKEMAAILRQIREKAGLSQREVALRMGIKSKSGRSFIAQLESGRIKNPTLRTIFDYLHTCGASFREFFAKLETIDFQTKHKQLIAKVNLPEGKAKKKIERDVAWFEAGIKYPRKITQKPLSTEKQEEMSVEFAKYRIKIEKIESEVHKLLCDFAPGTFYFPFYKDCARAFYSALVKYYGKAPKKLDQKLTEIVKLGVKNGLKENILLKIKEKVISVFKSQVGTDKN